MEPFNDCNWECVLVCKSGCVDYLCDCLGSSVRDRFVAKSVAKSVCSTSFASLYALTVCVSLCVCL